eukprot:1645333-Rhodomonas_salina.1
MGASNATDWKLYQHRIHAYPTVIVHAKFGCMRRIQALAVLCGAFRHVTRRAIRYSGLSMCVVGRPTWVQRARVCMTAGHGLRFGVTNLFAGR